MANWNGYFYIEALSLTPAQKQTLVDALKGIGERNLDEHPNERNHWRTRLDQQAVIFQAVFNADQLTAAALKSRLAGIFGVNENLITVTNSTNQYGAIAVFKYNNVDRLRVGVFGGRSSTYQQSHDAAFQYLTAFTNLWNTR